MGRLVRLSLPVLTLAFVCLCSACAEACPMCSQSLAEENALPRAYMYSILFMLGMPATIFSGFGLTLFYKFRNYNAAQAALSAEESLPPVEAGAPPSVQRA
ncbi:MAG: hypothetical protein EXS05_05640 [Planctomycetaceae bacterium]|nr:hypothetical protein [Planctomycetaceae bacterium]